jgi:hypothetical protein
MKRWEAIPPGSRMRGVLEQDRRRQCKAAMGWAACAVGVAALVVAWWPL